MSRVTWGFVLLAVGTAFLAAPVASECVEFDDGEGGKFSVGCEGRKSDPGGDTDGNWFTGPVANTMYALVSIAGATGATVFGVARVRRRRRELRTFIHDVETTFAAAKASPDDGLPKLEALRKGLQKSHDAHRLEDAQFLEMDKRLADYIVRVRLLHLERWFPNLPIALISEIRTVISDGHFSSSDLSLIDKRAVQLAVEAHIRKDLLMHLASWAQQDVNVHPVQEPGAPFAVAPPARRRIAVLAKK